MTPNLPDATYYKAERKRRQNLEKHYHYFGHLIRPSS
jgi:hypothetical protein